MAEQDKSPSPAPPPPLPAAPGPRASALVKLYNDAINHILRVCSYDNFAGCFPTPAQEVPESLANLYQQFTSKVGDSLRSEFDGILAQREVTTSLNDLDRLVDQARKRKANAEGEAQCEHVEPPVPPHTMPAQELFLAHLAPSLGAHKAGLESRLDATRSENTQLLDNIMKQRVEIERLVAGLENVAADLDASVMGPEQMEGLRNDTREAEDMALFS